MTAKKAPIAIKTDGKKIKDDFVHKVGAVDVRLPSLTYLKPGLIRKIRRLGDVDAMYTLMEMVLGESELEAIDDMDPDEYEAMLDGWKEHSGISLGES